MAPRSKIKGDLAMAIPRWTMAFLVASGVFAGLSDDAFGHGGLFRGPTGRSRPEAVTPPDTSNPSGLPTPGVTIRARALPGSGPQIPFSSERWEFWWDYNRDPIIQLKDALARPRSQQSTGLVPFTPPTEEDVRTKLIPFLVGMLRDDDDQVRSAAAMSLARLGVESVVPYVGHVAIQDPSLGASTNAIVALGLSRQAKAEETLLSIFGNDELSTELRAYSAVSLALIGTKKASQTLRDAIAPRQLRRFKYQLRLALAYAIGLTKDSDNAPAIRDILVSGAADDTLTESLLIQSLGKLGDRAANPILLDALRHDDAQIRRSATIALGAIASSSDRDVIDSLVSIARDDNDNQNRSFAFIALAKIAKGGHPAIEKFLLERFSSVPHHARSFVAISLGLIGNQELVPRLLKALATEKELSLRSSIAMALGMLGHTDAIDPVRSLFEGTIEPVQKGYLALALGLLGAEEAAPQMHKVLMKEVDLELLVNTSTALGLMGDRKALEILQKRLKDEPDQMTKSAMVYGMGLIGDMSAIDTLFELARHKKESDIVRAFAVLAVGHLGSKSSIPIDSEISADVNYTLDVTFITELWNLL